MNKKYFITSFALVSALVPAVSFADIDIVITPSGQEQAISDVNAQVEVITHEEIEQTGASDIAELVATRAGVDIGRYGGNGQFSSIFIRGANSDHTLVLVDGVNIASDIGQAAIQNIDLNAVERIEIVKGGAATLYGSGALGGVINIITRKHDSDKPFTARVNTTVGSYDLKKYSASIDYKKDIFTGGVLFGHQEAKGPSAQEKPDDKDAYKNGTVKAYAKIDNGAFSLEGQVWQAKGEVEYDSSFGPDPVQDFKNQVAEVSAGYKTDLVHGTVSISQTKDEIHQQKIQSDANTERQKISSKWAFKPSQLHQFTVGGELEKVQSDYLYVSSFSTSKYDEKYKDKALFAAYSLNYEKHDFDLGLRRVDVGKYGEKTLGSVYYGYDITPNFTAFTGVNTAFKSPSLSELYNSFNGNPNLKPEDAKTKELGLKYTNSGHIAKATLFDTEFENLISSGQNIAEARNKGGEFSYQYSQDGFAYHANFTVQDPKNAKTGKRLVRRSKISANAGVNYENSIWGAGASLTYVGDRADADFSSFPSKEVELDDYALLDVSGSYFVNDHVTVRAVVKNVADVKYETAKGYNNPRVNYQISTDIKF